MQRLLIIAGSVLALTACSGMNGMTKDHHDNNYSKLAKIAKQENTQFALLLNHKGELAVVDVDTGKLVPPGDIQKPTAQDGMVSHENPISDEEFAEIKRRFDSTIKIETKRGSVCITFARQPPGKEWTVCYG